MAEKPIKERLSEMSAFLKKTFKFEDTTEGAGTPDEGASKPKEYSLADGKKVLITDLKEGGIVTAKGADDKEALVPAGDLTLLDGTVLTIGEAGAITAIKAPETTPEQQAQEMREMVQKFAAGTPEERIANIEACTKALMNYAFGWEMRRSEEEQGKQAALTAFQTMKAQDDEKHTKHINEVKQAFTDHIQKQNTVIQGLVAIMQELSETPGTEPLAGGNKNKEEHNENRRNTLGRRMAAASEIE